MNSRFILVLLSLLTIFTTISYAQIQPATPKKFVDGLKSLTCGTQPVSYEDELEMQRLIANLTNQKLVTRSSTTYLAIKPHLIRRDDGSGALDLSQLNDALAELNRQFAAMNVQFYFCGTSPNYINNTGAYDWTFTSADRDVMTNANNVNNAHNVYFSGSLGGVGGFSFGATQNRVNNRTFVLNGQANDDKTLTHEIGHYFNLSHTFRNSAHATIARRELVTRISPETGARLAANCSTEGDFICDTPADPYELTGGDLSSNCVYTGTVTDANGDAFMPSMTNIMNYYFCDPYDFTAGQYARMTAALAVNNTPSSNPSTNYTLDCPETVQSAPSSVTATLVSTSVNLGVTLTWSHASSVETGYIIERSTSPTSGFIPIGGVEPDVFTFKDASATSGTTYYYRIKPSNTKDNYGSNGTVTTPITCGATYSSPCTVGGTTAAHIINNFIIKTTSNTILIDNSNSGCSANSYGDYTGLSASVSAGTTYNFTMNTFYGSNGYFPQHIGIFIDINNDGDFSDVGEQVYQSTGTVMSGTTLITGSFTVPSTAINGSTRLRIRSRNNSEIVTSACGSFSSGETEDYTLIISGGACTPPTVSITGATSICVGLTTTLSPTTGGTWASSNTAVATVTNAGVVSGVSNGTATFTFTQTSTGCINTTASVSVNALPSVSITGSNPICVGASTALSPTTGGTWASSNTAVATVTNAGVVSGVSGGTATFTFTQTSTGCVSAQTAAVTVNALPTVTITGTTHVNIGATTTLSPTTGGTWTSSNTAVATVTNAGVVTGVSSGIATFIFTQTSTGCSSAATSAISVGTLPIVSITGSNSICVGATTTLSPTTGGTWASSNTAVATVTNAGIVTGVSGGTATFTYTQTSTGLPATTAAVTVNSLPTVSITGSLSINIGSTTTLSPTLSGTWVSNNPTVASVTNAGLVTGLSSGSATFTFTLSSLNCSATTAPITISSSIVFPNVVCPGSQVVNFENLVNGSVAATTATTHNGIATSITFSDNTFNQPCGSTARPDGFPFNATFNSTLAAGIDAVVAREFTANFGSGTSSTCTQVLYIKLPDPNRTQAPESITAPCQNGVPNSNPNNTGYPRFSNGNAILDVSQGLTSSYTDAPITGGVLIRTWTVKNKCGVGKTFIQSITIPTCVTPQIAISGDIKRETGDAVTATVKIFNTRDSLNTADGSFYKFPSLPMGESYRIRPERNTDVLNGVSTFDINVIAKYLLGLEPAQSPYQLIAMDVNRNGEIEGGDMLIIRNLILRKTDNFPNNTAWRFIPKNYVFKNPANPFAEDFPEILSINNTNQNVTDADFVAVKVGDGNLSARTSNLTNDQVRNSPETEYLQLPDMLLEQGNTYEIPLKISAKALVALQFALTVDKNAVESFSIENGDLAQFGEGNYNILGKNTVATAWASTKATHENTIFTLVLKVKKQVSTKDLISINTAFSDNLGFDTEGGEKHLQLRFTGEKTNNPTFDLHQNRPNPFSSETTISFILPETNTAELSIFDITGRKVYTLNRSFSKGYNEVILNKTILQNTGVYFYRLQSDKFVAVKRMFYLN